VSLCQVLQTFIVMLNVVELSVVMLSVVMLSVVMLSVVMLSFVMLSVILLSVVMLNVVVLSVVAPKPNSLKMKTNSGKKTFFDQTNFFVDFVAKTGFIFRLLSIQH
jgi:hypothetical protein